MCNCFSMAGDKFAHAFSDLTGHHPYCDKMKDFISRETFPVKSREIFNKFREPMNLTLEQSKVIEKVIIGLFPLTLKDRQTLFPLLEECRKIIQNSHAVYPNE